MVSICTRKILVVSLVLLAATPASAWASSDTCLRDDSVLVATMHAARTYHPPGFEDDSRTLSRPAWFFAPLVAHVVSGQAGPFLASFSWRDEHGGVGACVYEGTGNEVRSGTCSGNGDEYRLGLCALINSSGISFFGAEGLIREATSIRFHILGGDSCAPTVAEIDLASPPDRDGDGIPDCLEGSTDRSPPTWPGGSTLTATPLGSSVNLEWTPATDNFAVVGYRVFEDGSVVEDISASTLSAQVAPVTANAIHLFQVQAFDAAGNQSTDGPSANSVIDTQPPIWPSGSSLAITPVGLSAATLAWPSATDSVGVSAYRIYQDEILAGSTREQTFDVSNLDPSHLYSFVVQAVDAAGNESSDGPSATLSLDTSAPAWPAPSVLSAEISSGAATLVWTPATDNFGVSSYLILQDDELVGTVPATNLMATITGLAPNVSYRFQIQAADAAGNTSADGPVALGFEDTLAPTWPAGAALTATAATLMSASLSWTPAADNVGVAGYLVFANGLPVAQIDGSTPSAAITGLDPSLLYSFQIQALDAAGNASADGPQAQIRLDVTPPTWPPGSALAVTSGMSSVSLAWTPAIDDVGVAGYRVYEDAQPVATVGGGALATQIPLPSPNVPHTVQVQAFDRAGNATVDGPTTTLRIDTVQPAWPADSSLIATVTGAQSIHLAWTAATDDVGVVHYLLYQDGVAIRTVDGNTRSSDIVGLDAAATQVFRIEASDSAGNTSTGGPTASVHIGTPSPALVAPALDTNAGTTVLGAFAFLTEGPNPIQTGVAPGTVVKQRAALVRGHVSDRDGVDLQDVTVTILRHPELGSTQTHLDGTFDLLVNGGEDLAILFAKPGYLPIQRHVLTSWNSTHSVTDVALVALDTNVTEIVSDAATSQVARGSVVSDADGARQATLVIPSDTSASLLMADGSTVPLSTYHVRATELTVGPLGPQAMPGDLPPLSGYTYAVELNADEAIASGAQSIVFSKPISAFVENFLKFPIGETVPVGFYDRSHGQWVAIDSGQVIGIVGSVGGLAAIDVDGDGLADDASKLAPLGITDEERAELAQMYTAGTSLWRFKAPHFTTYDCNWARILPSDATSPTTTPAPRSTVDNQPCHASGSIIECENQTLGEDIGITGTGIYLHYQSDRTLGRTAERTIDIPLIGGVVPPSLSRIELDVTIAGQHHHSSFTPQPNLATTFVWDGRDVYGRVITGTHHATVMVTYPYPQIYQRTLRFGLAAFVSALDSQGINIQVANANREISLAKSVDVPLFSMPTTADNSLGGWTISASHTYDPAGSLLYRGDGLREPASPRVRFLPGNFLGATALLPLPDGSIAFTQNNNIWKLGPDGSAARIAGSPSGTGGFSGDGEPALLALLRGPNSLALGPDGSIYFRDSGNNRVRRVDSLGFISTVAGNGVAGSTGDGGPATSASIRLPGFTGPNIAVDRSGNLFIAEDFRIRRVAPDGQIALYAGKGCPTLFCESGDGGPAALAELSVGGGIAAGPDGSLYVASAFSNTVRRIGPQGIITKVVGNGQENPSGDDGPAPAAATNPGAIAVDSEGRLNIFESSVVVGNLIRQVDSDGLIHRVAGAKGTTLNHDGDPPLAFVFSTASWAFGFSPGGQLISQLGVKLLAVDNGTRLGATTAFAVPSRDGSEYYGFDALGRHIATHDTTTGVTRASFGYTGLQLTSITDVDGNQLQIGRPDPSTILLTAPFGQTTTLGLNSDGRLTSVTDPLGQTVQLGYANTDLLASLTDPYLGTSTFEYDADGRLTKDTNAGGGYQTLGRTQQGSLSQATRTTRLGRATTYQTDLSNPNVVAKTTTEAGMQSTATVNANGVRSATYADGTQVASFVGQDPRFGMEAPLLSSSTATTPGGRSLATTHAASATLATPGDPLSLSNLSQTTTVNGTRTWTSSYTAGTRTFAQQSPSGRKVTAQIDANGHVVQLNEPGRLAETFQYDSRGRVIEAQQGSRIVSLEYDATGNVSHVTLPDSRDLRTTYDALGRPLIVVRPDGRQIQFGYELAGRRALTTPPERPTHIEEVNPEARTSDYVPPALGEVTTARLAQFDFDGQLQSEKNESGDLISVDRDTAGRPIHVNTPRGTFLYAYNQTTGLLIGAHTPDGRSEAYTYDGHFVLGVAIAGQMSANVTFDYDEDLRLAAETVNGDVVGFGYDSDNLLTQVGALLLDRDVSSGDVMTMTLDGVSLAFGRNGYGEVDHIGATFASAAILTDDVASRDPTGRILSRHENIAGESHMRDYSYDALGRLTDVAVDGASSAHYDYDENGNRTERDGAESVQRLSYDAQDRLVSAGAFLYSYTAEGMLDDIVDTTTGASTTYDYDVGGNLLSVVLPSGEHIDYLVDAAGRRVGRKANGALTNRWVYGVADGPVAEIGVDGRVVARFVYATKSWVPAYILKDGTAYFAVTDRVGSVRLIVDASTGAVAQRLDYDEFGQVLLDTNPGFQPFGFGGGMYDPETALVHLGAREYDPRIGRWTSKDPLLFGAHDTNLYGYAGGDPINSMDPSGLLILPADPSSLPPEWMPDPTCRAPNRVRFKHPSGDTLEFDRGQPGVSGWRGKDHWHHNGQKTHLKPGTQVPDPPPTCGPSNESPEDNAEDEDPTPDPAERTSGAPCAKPNMFQEIYLRQAMRWNRLLPHFSPAAPTPFAPPIVIPAPMPIPF